jgi:hypothetical protein
MSGVSPGPHQEMKNFDVRSSRGCSGKGLFAAAGGFPVKLQKFPCSVGIPAGSADFAAFRCISGAEPRKINHLVLIFSGLARARARVNNGAALESRRLLEGREEARWKSGLASCLPTVIAG